MHPDCLMAGIFFSFCHVRTKKASRARCKLRVISTRSQGCLKDHMYWSVNLKYKKTHRAILSPIEQQLVMKIYDQVQKHCITLFLKPAWIYFLMYKKIIFCSRRCIIKWRLGFNGALKISNTQHKVIKYLCPECFTFFLWMRHWIQPHT